MSLFGQKLLRKGFLLKERILGALYLGCLRLLRVVDVTGKVEVSPLVQFRFGGTLCSGTPVTLHDRTKLKERVRILCRGGQLRIGERSSINDGVTFYLYSDICIGKNVRVASGAKFIAFNHVFADTGVPISDQGNTTKGITIDDDVWIGANVVILDGVHIHGGSVVAAGSVVSRDVPPNVIIGGVPAKLIKQR